MTVTVVRDIEEKFIKGVYASMDDAVERMVGEYANDELSEEEQIEEIFQRFEFLGFTVE